MIIELIFNNYSAGSFAGSGSVLIILNAAKTRRIIAGANVADGIFVQILRWVGSKYAIWYLSQRFQ